MISRHGASGVAASPTLLTSTQIRITKKKRPLHIHNRPFLHDLIHLFTRFNPRSKSLNTQGQQVKQNLQLNTRPHLAYAIQACF